MLYRMKVTALIPDEIIREVAQEARGKTLTESLMIALQEWIQLRKISSLNNQIQNKPLEFQKGFSAARVRMLNRKS